MLTNHKIQLDSRDRRPYQFLCKPPHHNHTSQFYGIPKIHTQFKHLPPLCPIIPQAASILAPSAQHWYCYGCKMLCDTSHCFVPTCTSIPTSLFVNVVQWQCISLSLTCCHPRSSSSSSSSFSVLYFSLLNRGSFSRLVRAVRAGHIFVVSRFLSCWVCLRFKLKPIIYHYNSFIILASHIFICTFSKMLKRLKLGLRIILFFICHFQLIITGFKNYLTNSPSSSTEKGITALELHLAILVEFSNVTLLFTSKLQASCVGVACMCAMQRLRACLELQLRAAALPKRHD